MTPETARGGIVIHVILYEGKVAQCEGLAHVNSQIYEFLSVILLCCFFEAFRAGEMLIFLFSVLEKHRLQSQPLAFFHACHAKSVQF